VIGRKSICAVVLALLGAGMLSGSASAHGFGERYDLPVPLSLYMGGAALAVVLSFAVIGAFTASTRTGVVEHGHGYVTLNVRRLPMGSAIAHPVLLFALKGGAVSVMVIYIVAGYAGSPDPTRNPVPVMTWAILWIGIAYVSAFVGNIWALINPWKVAYGWAESVYRWMGGRDLSHRAKYPERLGAWPAFALFSAFAWVEIVDPQSAVPSRVATMALLYSLVTFAGMFWFGRGVWLRNGEFFSLIFGFLSKFSPTEVHVWQPDGKPGPVDDYEAFAAASQKNREWNIRPWGAGLLSATPLSLSQATLLVLLLATVSFDGFTETPLWANAASKGYNSLRFLGDDVFTATKTIGLMVGATLFFAVFYLVALLIGQLAGKTAPSFTPAQLVQTFAYSLVPIALAYHLAHFFSFLAIQGQLIIPIASDPFTHGWDIFGTADWRPNVGIVNARLIWFLSISAIVVGHIVAVYVAHVYALRVFGDRLVALRSQLAMLVLMVAYTMISLWIVAQPITIESR